MDVRETLKREGILWLQMLPEAAAEDVPAWELLEAGRYMPRRIRGSFRGRELG
jgi:hypothetical protein